MLSSIYLINNLNGICIKSKLILCIPLTWRVKRTCALIWLICGSYRANKERYTNCPSRSVRRVVQIFISTSSRNICGHECMEGTSLIARTSGSKEKYPFYIEYKMFRQLFQHVGGICRAANHALFANASLLANPPSSILGRYMATLAQMHRKHPNSVWMKTRKNKNPLGYNVPFAKGIVIRPVIRKPKKPNSANRKCVLLKLSSGKETIAYIPKEGNNLQEHNIVLVRVGRLKDCPGVRLRCVRGKYDLPHPEKKKE